MKGSLVDWLLSLTPMQSPLYAMYSWLIHTTVYLTITALFIILFKLIFKNRLKAKWHFLIWAVLLIRFIVSVFPSSPVSIFNTVKVDEGVIEKSSYQTIVTPSDNEAVAPDEDNPEGIPAVAAVTFTEKWRQVYGGDGYDADGKYTSGDYAGYYVGPTNSLRSDRYEEHTTYKSVQTYSQNTVDPANQNLTLETNLVAIARGTIHIPRFLVMPMAAHAKSITFHLQTDKYSDDTTPTRSLRSADNIVFDHTSKNYGVGNTLNLPWMMRSQYCDYQFYLVDIGDNILDTRKGEGKIDDLTYTENELSNAHRLSNRSGNDYTTFWSGGTDLSSDANCYITQGEGASAYHEYVVPQDWADKDVFILVKYKPSAEFEAMKSTGANAAKWVNIMNVENGNMMRYTRTDNVTGESRDSLNDVTNDYLWAIEGDPYGFKLHNRYADHGFDGITQNEKWSTLLTTDKVNSTENFNYRSGVSDGNERFTYDANGDPVIKSGITYGSKSTSDAFGTMSETTTNTIFEAMTGNYDEGMIIHPVNGCINIKDQNGYKYFGAYLFNGAPTGDPVQLNYMQDWR
jgi:energy-coupling factor transporter transmembrane protein EcfT